LQLGGLTKAEKYRLQEVFPFFADAAGPAKSPTKPMPG
jgi:hypothetical protein